MDACEAWGVVLRTVVAKVLGGEGKTGGDGDGGDCVGSAEFLSQMDLDTVDDVLETTDGMRVWGGISRVVAFAARGRVAGSPGRRETERDRRRAVCCTLGCGEARASGLVPFVGCHLASGWRCWVGGRMPRRWKRGPRGQAPKTQVTVGLANNGEDFVSNADHIIEYGKL